MHDVRSMSSRAECYRRWGLEAQQRAAQTTEEKIKDAFETVAGGWFLLAEQLDWLEKERTRTDDTQQEPGRIPTASREMPRNRAHGFSRQRAARPSGQGRNLGPYRRPPRTRPST